ncbi:MAG TPA: hypothetical protein PK843_01250 [bacterium]|mgnify:CR=1 FL=1|nr:hypothetical protein [bacterium]
MHRNLCLFSLAASLMVAPMLHAGGDPLPEAWLARWRNPLPQDRPLKIIHGIPPDRATPEAMRSFRERGLGGLVVNVAFEEYLRSDAHWQTLIQGLHNGQEAGLIFWIYDEQGYPSGAAGGLVLEKNPQYEAQELAYDARRSSPFLLRSAFEYTHAANNFYAVRRYINIMDDRAVQSFIRSTHDQYLLRLQNLQRYNIRAFFTDEPSLIAVDLGQISEPSRSKVPIVDNVDSTLPELPSVPWVYDLEERYQQKYGQKLQNQRLSLFSGDEEKDRSVRRRFWSLVADLVSERYFGALQKWCAQNRVASSGHTLREESLVHHVPLEGNALKVLGRMDIPGLDMLSSDPQEVVHQGWLTAALPLSAVILNGRRHVMTEVSDFEQTLNGRGPASLDKMRATAAWQAAWGVTDFTLYYDIDQRPAEEVKAYGDFVGRLNALLADSRPSASVLLYYPIRDLWEEYRPQGEYLSLQNQSTRARKIVDSFMLLGQTLQQHQINFLLVDHEWLATAVVDANGVLRIGDLSSNALLIPAGCTLEPGTEKKLALFRNRGGVLMRDDGLAPVSGADLILAIKPEFLPEPWSGKMVVSRFQREGRQILQLTNVDDQEWQGVVTATNIGDWIKLDPVTAEITAAARDESGRAALRLSPWQTVLLLR